MGVPVLYAGSHYKPGKLVPIPPPVLVLPQVASATLLRDWRALDFNALPDGTPLPDTWTSHDAQAHVLNRGAGSSHLIVSRAGTTNNRIYVELNGLDDYLIDIDSSDLDNLDSFAVFMASDWTPLVAKMTRTSDGAGWALCAQSTEVLIQEDGGANYIEKDCDNPVGFTGITTMEVVSKSEIHIYQDNDNSTEVDYSNPPVSDYSTSQLLHIGAWSDLHAFSGGWLFGLLIYSPAPNATDRALITQWMIDNELGTET